MFSRYDRVSDCRLCIISLSQDKLVERLAKSGNGSGQVVVQEHLHYNKELMESMERYL